MLDFLFLEDFLGTQCPVVLLRCVPFGHRFVLGLDWFGGLGDALLGDALLGLAGEALVDLMGSHPMGHTIGLVLVLFVRTQRPVFLFLRVPLGHRCDIYNTMILSETRRRRVMIGELMYFPMTVLTYTHQIGGVIFVDMTDKSRIIRLMLF